jgi:hypothetical protein
MPFATASPQTSISTTSSVWFALSVTLRFKGDSQWSCWGRAVHQGSTSRRYTDAGSTSGRQVVVLQGTVVISPACRPGYGRMTAGRCCSVTSCCCGTWLAALLCVLAGLLGKETGGVAGRMVVLQPSGGVATSMAG